MQYSYVARQPILDREKKTIAYELLFRDGPNNAFPLVDPEHATSRLLIEQFLTYQGQTIDGKLGFVNFTCDSILKQTPVLFPKEQMVIEILETSIPSDELLKEIKSLKSKGYKVALDDFIPSPEWNRFLPYVDIIKLDIHQVSIPKAALLIKRLEETEIKFLAEKVETYDEFEKACNVGFDYFQGYFFGRPEIIEKKTIKPSFNTVIELLKYIASEEIDFVQVEKLISSDVTLSFKLLRYVNATSSIKTEISSFRQALAYLGEDKVRKFVSLVALAIVNEGKPEALYNLSIQRGRFCELIMQTVSHDENRDKGFLCGMFSLLDSLLDQDLESIAASLPVSKEIQNALILKEGVLGEVLALVIAIEQADWPKVVGLERQLKLSEAAVSEAYQHSICWTDEVFS
ncbi:histidine kinase [Vibrio sp. HA2012]|uniref:EAL and HDOD domain-containing protein n=1 Tax=Vibrio sp. HA2012 TaxID=1971595 RepID=UPI000C2BFEBC|nr:EAL domain-containing protein [Vibrio sp. HA2012]PJC87632.1 histidine kinase [Vibrio sp. HA2012]